MNTERLIIQPLAESDTNFIYELLNSEGWIKYIGNRNIKSLEDATAYIRRIENNHNTTYWTVFLKETKEAIGIITLIKRDYLDYQDIGFAFLPAYSHKGYAYEATLATLKYLSTNQPFEKIGAITIRENVSSIKLIKRLGLKFERELEQENEKLFLYSASKDKLGGRDCLYHPIT